MINRRPKLTIVAPNADPDACLSNLSPDMDASGNVINDKNGNPVVHARPGDPRHSTVFWVNQQQNAGPLGYGSIAAHGHADALAFTLSLGGLEFLIDPGTYAYHTKKQWRDYFRGTGAHNTVRVDVQDQSVAGGNFLWLEHARVRCIAWEESAHTDRFAGEHDGYLRLLDPVKHAREMLFDKANRRLVITDRIECKARHTIEQRWHFAEDVVVTLAACTEEVI